MQPYTFATDEQIDSIRARAVNSDTRSFAWAGVALSADQREVRPHGPHRERRRPVRGAPVITASLLRRGPLTPLELRNRISDDLLSNTYPLIDDMARPDAWRGAALIVTSNNLWYLTETAVAWLEGPEGGGLDAHADARWPA